MRFVLPSPRQSQNPLVRIATTVVALVCLGVLIALGALALAVLLAGGLLWYAWFRWRVYRMRKQAAAGPPPEPGVIEGEYVVVHEHRDHAHSNQDRRD